MVTLHIKINILVDNIVVEINTNLILIVYKNFLLYICISSPPLMLSLSYKLHLYNCMSINTIYKYCFMQLFLHQMREKAVINQILIYIAFIFTYPFLQI